MIERKMEHELGMDFLRVVEAAAIASAQTMGQGDRKYSDHVAVEAMRATMDTVPMRGEVVIGEGERDEAPMLYIGEKVGLGYKADTEDGAQFPEVDIAVDPLEGTNLCATGSANAIAVMACSEKNGLLRAPDVYMQKLIVGPSSKGAVDLDAPVKDNLRAIARRLNRDIEDLVVIVLDRPRHKKLIGDIREAGARIRLISDGDLSAGISAAVAGSGVHAGDGDGRGARRRAHGGRDEMSERADTRQVRAQRSARRPGRPQPHTGRRRGAHDRDGDQRPRPHL